MPSPNDYLHIKAWCQMQGSFDFYTRSQQARAAADKAPLNACYLRFLSPSESRWVTIDEIESDVTQQLVNSIVEEIKQKEGLNQ